jgi:hypothetical protein
MAQCDRQHEWIDGPVEKLDQVRAGARMREAGNISLYLGGPRKTVLVWGRMGAFIAFSQGQERDRKGRGASVGYNQMLLPPALMSARVARLRCPILSPGGIRITGEAGQGKKKPARGEYSP